MRKRRENGDVHVSRETWRTLSTRVLQVSRDTYISSALLFFGWNYSLLAAYKHNWRVFSFQYRGTSLSAVLHIVFDWALAQNTRIFRWTSNDFTMWNIVVFEENRTVITWRRLNLSNNFTLRVLFLLCFPCIRAYLPPPRVQKSGDFFEIFALKECSIFDHVWILSEYHPRAFRMFSTAIFASTDINSMGKPRQLSTIYGAIWLFDFWPITLLVKYVSIWLLCFTFFDREQLKYDD